MNTAMYDESSSTKLMDSVLIWDVKERKGLGQLGCVSGCGRFMPFWKIGNPSFTPLNQGPDRFVAVEHAMPLTPRMQVGECYVWSDYYLQQKGVRTGENVQEKRIRWGWGVEGGRRRVNLQGAPAWLWHQPHPIYRDPTSSPRTALLNMHCLHLILHYALHHILHWSLNSLMHCHALSLGIKHQWHQLQCNTSETFKALRFSSLKCTALCSLSKMVRSFFIGLESVWVSRPYYLLLCNVRHSRLKSHWRIKHKFSFISLESSHWCWW